MHFARKFHEIDNNVTRKKTTENNVRLLPTKEKQIFFSVYLKHIILITGMLD